MVNPGFFTNALQDSGVLLGTEKLPLDLPSGASRFTTPAELAVYLASAKPTLFAVLSAADQGLVTGVPSKINLDLIQVFGTPNYWDPVNFLYKPQLPGTYMVSAEGYVTGTSVTGVEVVVSKNGTTGSGGVEVVDVFAVLGGVPQFGTSTSVGFVSMDGVNDTLELDITGTGTGALLAKALRNTTALSVMWVGA